MGEAERTKTNPLFPVLKLEERPDNGASTDLSRTRRNTPPIGSGCLGRRGADNQENPVEVELVDPSEALIRRQRELSRKIAIWALESMLSKGRLKDFRREAAQAVKRGWITWEDEDDILREAGIRY